MSLTALRTAAFAALDAALTEPVYEAPPSTAAPPFVLYASDTAADGPAGSDADGRATEDTLTFRVFAPTGPAVRALADATKAALLDEADMRSRLTAAGGPRLSAARLDLDTTGPEHDLSADDPLGDRLVRVRFRLAP